MTAKICTMPLAVPAQPLKPSVAKTMAAPQRNPSHSGGDLMHRRDFFTPLYKPGSCHLHDIFHNSFLINNMNIGNI